MNRNTSSLYGTPQRPARSRRATMAPELSPVGQALNAAFMTVWFTALPVIVLVMTHWALFAIGKHAFYQDAWVGPAVLMLSAFLGGALIRQKTADEQGGMGFFLLGLLALCLFAGLTWLDINTGGDWYSRFLPRLLGWEARNYVFAIPGAGLVGMLCFKWFTVRNYG